MLGQVCRDAKYIDGISAKGQDSSNECPRYDTNQSYGEVSLVPGIWGMRSNSFLPSLPGRLELGVIAPDMVLSIGRIRLNCVLMLN